MGERRKQANIMAKAHKKAILLVSNFFLVICKQEYRDDSSWVSCLRKQKKGPTMIMSSS